MISRQFLRKMSNHSGVPLKGIIDFLENFAGPNLAEDWDNTGLLLEPQTPTPVKTVLLTNDLTEAVAAESVEKAAQLIISYHPPIFSSLKKITTKSWKERVIGLCLENKIAVYSPHTRWDSVDGGVNDWLLSPYDLQEKSPIVRKEGNCGAGRSGKLKTALTLKQVIEKASTLTSEPSLRLALAYNATLDSPVKTLGVCAGAGASLITETSVDVFLTGELPHHVLLDAAHTKTSVILYNHSNSERGYLSVFAKKMAGAFSGLNVIVSESDKDPIGTLVQNFSGANVSTCRYRIRLHWTVASRIDWSCEHIARAFLDSFEHLNLNVLIERSRSSRK